LQHTGEQVDAAAGELVFVEADLDPMPTSEAEPVLALQTGVAGCAVHFENALDLLFARDRVAEVVQAEELLQGFASPVHQREVVERQLGNQPPQQGLAE